MKLYKTIYLDDDTPEDNDRRVWDGTQADAAKRRKALKTEGMRMIVTDEVDVPTSKSALLAWLNGGAS